MTNNPAGEIQFSAGAAEPHGHPRFTSHIPHAADYLDLRRVPGERGGQGSARMPPEYIQDVPHVQTGPQLLKLTYHL